MNIGIVGHGYVGKATKLLGCRDDAADLDDNIVLVYDIDKDKRVPSDLQMKDLVMCDVVFVCVPTPALKSGACDTRIVESVVGDLKDIGVTGIVVRSTVPVGTCERLGVAFMPEFLTESCWEDDFRNNKDWIIGIDGPKPGEDVELLKVILRKILITAKRNEKIQGANLVWASTREAEAAKLVRNSFLATKVSFCNEIYDWCQSMDISYGAVAQLMGMDDRIGPSHTQVPGPDDKRGYGGTCFPKDINSLLKLIEETGGKESYIIRSAVYRNEIIDRPEKDWRDDKGRAVTDED